MSKPDWKTKPHERKRMTLQQENSELKKRINAVTYERDEYLSGYRAAKAMRDELTQDSERYRVLRNKDVMVLDGEPKYLKGEDLDAYCDVEKEKFWGVSLSSMVNRAGGKGVTAQMMIQVIDDLQKEKNGNDTGSKSKEADSKDSGHHTDILRYADWDGLWKQRSA